MSLEALCRNVVSGCTHLLKATESQDISMVELGFFVLGPATQLLKKHAKVLMKYPSVAQQYSGKRATAQENRYEELREALGDLLLVTYMGQVNPQADRLRDLQDICGTAL